MKDYRHYVIKTLEVLEDSHGYIFAELLNLASTGEMQEIMSAFESGDSYDFQYGHFDDLEDKNIQKLIVVLRLLEKTFKEIKEDNNILSEEIFPDVDERINPNAVDRINSDREERFNPNAEDKFNWEPDGIFSPKAEDKFNSDNEEGFDLDDDELPF